MYKLFLAFRYLRAHRIVYWSIAAVAVGTFAVICVSSIMGGFARDIRARIRGFQSDLTISGANADLWIKDYDRLCRQVRELPHVRFCAPRVEAMAWIGESREMQPMMVLGVDPAAEAESPLSRFFANAGKRFHFRRDDGEELDRPGVVSGSAVDELGLGTRFTLVTPRDHASPPLRRQRVEVVGQFESRMAEYDQNYLLMSLPALQEWLGLVPPQNPAAVVNRVVIALDDYAAHGRQTRRAVVELLHRQRPCRKPQQHEQGLCGVYKVETWEEARSVLLQAISVERGIQFIILFLVVVVAGFNITAIYTLMVRAKTRDIGVVRALGATEKGVGWIFTLCGLLCGAFGAAFGAAMGWLVTEYINEIEAFAREWTQHLQPRFWQALGAAGLGLLSFVPLFLWWWGLGDVWRREKWRWGILTGALLAAATALAFQWTPGYTPGGRDPAIPPSLVYWLPALVAGAMIGITALRRAAEPLGGYLLGAALQLLVTLTGIVLSLGAVVFVAVTSFTVAMRRPPPFWRGFELFPRNVYYLDEIPVQRDAAWFVLTIVGALAVSIVFSLHPAARAAGYDPVSAIRDE